ncbi:hypothetical protein [Paenibacillus sp. GCM10027626]|uniref:hypothetical protein n=1 Tax=Paenibacillus sp. GCM10027626 TaxID=3273411 RepID=UPI0036437FB8
MEKELKIPQGGMLITVELTVKELMALTGAKFPFHQEVGMTARKKLNAALEQVYTAKGERDELRHWLI